jgi:hypothetical protein
VAGDLRQSWQGRPVSRKRTLWTRRHVQNESGDRNVGSIVGSGENTLRLQYETTRKLRGIIQILSTRRRMEWERHSSATKEELLPL